MDAEWSMTTLQDALEALAEVINELDDEPEAAEQIMDELMPAVYAKLNYAWNSRKLGPAAIDTIDHDELVGWPHDLKL